MDIKLPPKPSKRMAKLKKRVKNLALADDIDSLCNDLDKILARRNQTPQMLLRQAHILDRLFVHFASEAVESITTHGDYYDSTLSRAMELQEQCVATIKARSAMQYMNALTQNQKAEPVLLPPPPENVRGEDE
jgi:hypothetical protein